MSTERSAVEPELQRLQQLLVRMAALSEENIRLAVDALRRRDSVRLEEAVAADTVVDLTELEIDELCVSLLALRQPLGRLLRFVASALKIVKDVERVGDIAKGIARHGLQLLDERPVPFPPEIGEMAGLAGSLLRSSLDAFVFQDAVAAREVIARDTALDLLHRDNHRRLVEQMCRDAGSIPALAHFLSVNKALERVGDHSCNIAAMVVFLVEGKDIRHLGKRRGPARASEVREG